MNPVADVQRPLQSFERISATPSCEFVDEWYDMASGDHFWMAWRFRVIERMLRRLGFGSRSDVRALDIGGGSGVVRSEIEKALPFDVDCADLNSGALEHGIPGRGRTLFYDVTDRHQDLVGKYDLILLLDVLEHIEDTRPFAEAVADHLAPGGVLLVNVPALQWARSRYDDVVGHHRRYVTRTLRAEFEPIGLREVDGCYWGMSMVPILLVRALYLKWSSEEEIVSRGFEPPARWVGAVMTGLMKIETAILRRPPLGSSVLMAFQR